MKNLKDIKKPLVLISNDDGITSEAMQVLVEESEPFADVWVVAPDGERSAQSMSLTVNTYIKSKKLSEQRFCISGTPVDCVTLGLSQILPRKPDLVLSGINWGANMGRDTLFSGTLGIASTAALQGIPACGFSCEIIDPINESDRWHKSSYNLSACRKVISTLWKKRIFDFIPKGSALNVNIPSMDDSKLKGIKTTELGSSGYDHEMFQSQDPRGRKMYWYSGNRLANPDDQMKYDHSVVSAGFASLTLITPSLFHPANHSEFAQTIHAEGIEQ